MLKLELEIRNTENFQGTPTQVAHLKEIVEAVVSCGGFTGVKGGQTIIHFDPDGVFKKVELKYFPWYRRN